MTGIPRKEKTVLIADDELFNLQFVVDFLEAKSYLVEVAVNVDAAIAMLQKARYRMVLADLSIPLLPPHALLAGREPLFHKYPGLLIADYARNHNHTGRQVVIYSVHEDAQVRDFSKLYGTGYILKGRPRILKDEILDILSYDPLAKPKG